MTDQRLPVIELFGPTLQGEGALAGQVSHFVRFGGCDFRCLWCDSSPAVIPVDIRKNATLMTASEIVEKLCESDYDPPWVTLSGGNPALLSLGQLTDELHYTTKFQVAVETQGTFWKDWLTKIDLVTVSPKPPSSGMKNKQFSAFMTKAKDAGAFVVLKVPVFDERDLAFAKDVHLAYPGVDFFLSVVTRMGGLYGDYDGGAIDTEEDILQRYRWLVDLLLRDRAFRDVTAFPQIHALVWGHARGH